MARYRKSRRSSRGRRRNPASSQLRDGTMVSIDGRSVTLNTPYGETYEFDEVSPSGIKALYSAKNFGAAQKACNRSGILRAINPKRGRGRRRGKSRRNCGYAMNPKRGRGRRGKARRNAPISRRDKQALRRILKSHKGRGNRNPSYRYRDDLVPRSKSGRASYRRRLKGMSPSKRRAMILALANPRGRHGSRRKSRRHGRRR